jgi:hypothetical protein
VIAEQFITLRCSNGPLQNTLVESPIDMFVGRAVALPWKNIQGKMRYCVYVAIHVGDAFALMFVRMYERPEQAAAKVEELTYVAAAMQGAGYA